MVGCMYFFLFFLPLPRMKWFKTLAVVIGCEILCVYPSTINGTHFCKRCNKSVLLRVYYFMSWIRNNFNPVLCLLGCVRCCVSTSGPFCKIKRHLNRLFTVLDILLLLDHTVCSLAVNTWMCSQTNWQRPAFLTWPLILLASSISNAWLMICLAMCSLLNNENTD